MLGYSKPFSYSPGGQIPRGFAQDDFPQQKKPYMYDDLRVAPPQRNNFSRPNGRSIYMQRKEYSETLNKQAENLHVRVEHLFTAELDGKELKTIDDCLAKLKRLDAKGRLWPQQMIMEVQGGYVVLNDIETKAELDVLPLGSILQVKAVLDSCAYDSVLTVTVQERFKRNQQVYMYQCEETGAEDIKRDLDKFIQERGDDSVPNTDKSDMKRDLENYIGQQPLGRFKHPEPVLPVPREDSPQMWKEPEYMAPQRMAELRSLQSSPDIPVLAEQQEAMINTDIFNHVVEDLELFMKKLSYALVQQTDAKKSSSNIFKKKKSVKKAVASAPILPPEKEYIANLQKIKYGFNLLAQLEGKLTDPNAQDYVHILFTILQMMVAQYSADLPSNVISPLLTLPTLRLLSNVVTPEEERLWRSLGDCWNVPRSKWPDDVPPYIPEFYSGWQLPAPSYKLYPPSYESNSLSRSNSSRFPHDRSSPVELIMSSPPHSPSPPPFNEPPLQMRIIYDFMARNNQELSVRKGELVQVIQKSNAWCLVRNSHGEQGNVPHNVLEPVRSSGSLNRSLTRGGVNLDMNSTPAEVRAWLEHKGFSRMTVSSLGVLSGKLLLGMTKDEVRTVCPQEGSKVFFHLQSVKSSIALANEQSSSYNSRF